MLDIEGRIAMTVSCHDCDGIPKVETAGQTITRNGEHVQIMHNGIEVVAGGYHGDWMQRIIGTLRGHHEPQEELIFDAILPHCRPNSLMVELASFWAYYSLWYLSFVRGSSAICIEPDPLNMQVGKRNAALNGFADRVRFAEAWIGESAAPAHEAIGEASQRPITLPRIDAAALLEMIGGRQIELLHMDAQGAELGFLRSMERARLNERARFLVVSTHHGAISGSATTHIDCLAELERLGATILCEHSVGESFSGDGLIAASFRKEDAGVRMPTISRNNPDNSLFGA